VLYRVFLPHRAYRIFVCMHTVEFELGCHFRSNNFLESLHKAMKYCDLKCVVELVLFLMCDFKRLVN
jgi:hypothetical protein